MKRAIVYGALGGALIVLLRLVEYRHVVRAYPTEIYAGLVAAIFASLGIYFGARLRRPTKPEIREVVVRADQPFSVDESAVAALSITPRELEILGLIAEGLSNREIADRLCVSENTVKTHSSRVFQKLGVSRRTQAAQKGRELRLIP